MPTEASTRTAVEATSARSTSFPRTSPRSSSTSIVRARLERIAAIIPDAAQTSTITLSSPAALAGVAMSWIALLTSWLITGSTETSLSTTSFCNS
jgi:hypothetical protein